MEETDMIRLCNISRKAVLFAVAIVLLLAPAFSAQAQGKGFKDVVKHIEKEYGVKKTRIPMLGLANFAVKLIRPAGVKGFKLAVFEDQNFLARSEAMPFESVMRRAYNKDWMPLVQVSSKRGGGARTYIYVKNAGKDIQFALLSLEDREAVVLEVKFNPDAAVRFLENPKIMGISLGNSIRGNKNDIAANRSRPGYGVMRDSNRASATDVKDASSHTASTSTANFDSSMTGSNAGLKARPSLTASANDENNPPLPEDGTTARTAAKPAEVRPELPDKNAIRIETRLVNLNVKAMDRAGQPLTSLKLEDFNVFEDGVRQEVAHFKPVNAPVNVILLLDLSGSTKKKRKAMKEAAVKFVDALPAQDKVAIIAFTRRYRALTDFTTDKARMKHVLEEINGFSGGTAFYDSMWKALDQLNHLGDARKAIVVLTDGEDESIDDGEATEHTFDQLLERSSEEDVTIYPIYFSASNHYDKVGILFGGGNLMGNEKSKIARAQLGDLAEQTGGEVFNAQREEDLEDAYKRVAAELHTLYSLAYSPDKLKHNGEFRKISVKVNRDGALVKTRRGYYDR
jgi:VWFA-related protein